MTKVQYQCIWWLSFIGIVAGASLWDNSPTTRGAGTLLMSSMFTIMLLSSWTTFVNLSYTIHLGIASSLILSWMTASIYITTVTIASAVFMGVMAGVLFTSLIIALFIKRKP